MVFSKYEAIESLRLSKSQFKEPCCVSAHLTKCLKSHQIYGVRVLYRNYINNIGVVLNDCEGLGKRITIAILLHALFWTNSNIIRSPLILCFNEQDVDKWSYILQTFTGIETKSFNKNDPECKAVVIDNIQTCNLPKRSFDDFDYIVLEWPQLEDWLMIKEFLSQIKTKNRVVLTNRDLRKKLRELWECLEWVQPGYLGIFSHFFNKFSTFDIKSEHILSSLLKDVYVRHDVEDIHDEDFNSISAKNYKSHFENWKQNRCSKLNLSDSQTSSGRSDCENLNNGMISKQMDNNEPGLRAKNKPIFNLSSSSDDDLIHNNTSPNIFEEEEFITMNSRKQNENCSNIRVPSIPNNIQNTKENTTSNTSLQSLEIVSAHAISPSDYTSDETFERLNILSPLNEKSVKKGRSPKRKRITDSKWLSCPKGGLPYYNNTVSTNHADLMCSSDESATSLINVHIDECNETAEDIIDRTLTRLKERNKEKICQRTELNRDIEAEIILDNIFFS